MIQRKKPPVKPENDYRQYGYCAFMPNGNYIESEPDGSATIYYHDKRGWAPVIKRWISKDWYNDVTTNCL